MRTSRISPLSRFRLQSTTVLTGMLAIMAMGKHAYALPSGGNVVGGSAAIVTGGVNTNVTQATQRALIEWNNFNIGAGESVHFIQPSSSAVALNRVVGSTSASQINGVLQANGNVIIVNPEGVMFGAGANVNVGGLVATTADISNSNFMNGNLVFDRAGNPNATIRNDGNIHVAPGGLALMVGPNVTNNGLIDATLGKAQLASGDTFTVDLYGDGLLSLQASSKLTNQVVSNNGRIKANGGHVLLTAADAQNAVNSVINMDGLIEADSIGTKKGKVVLSSGKGTTLVSGKISAQGKNTGEVGGGVDVLGGNVAMMAGSLINVSGDAGGGKIRVGGDFHGGNAIPTAQNTVVQSGSNLLANAVTSGDGGQVSVWADNNTLFAGSIEATGGKLGGNGGFVETSGKEYLDAIGLVNASASMGQGGTWLLDPSNITITDTPNSDNNVTGNPIFTSTANGARVSVKSIQDNLNLGTNVSITTSAGSPNNEAGNITVASDISKTGGADAGLTLSAHNNIILNSGVDITSSSGKLNVTLNSNKDASGGGALVMNSGSSIRSNGGDITLGGGANPLTTAAKGNSSSVIGVNLDGSTLDAAGGNISIRGAGFSTPSNNNYGVALQNGAVVKTSGAGTVNITGDGGTGGASDGNYGVYLTGSGTKVSTENGALTIKGTGGSNNNANSDQNAGIRQSNNATVTSTGSGTISMTGIAGGDKNVADGNVGIMFDTGVNTVSSASGDITLATDTLSLSDTLDVHTSGTATVQPTTANTTIGVAGAAGTLQLTNAILNSIHASKIVVGSSAGTGALTANANSWNQAATLLTGNGGITINGLQTMGDNIFLAKTGAGNITLGASGGVSSTAAGDAITLASGGNFINNAGASALNVSNGRWLVFSNKPVNDTIGGLTPDFKRYSCAYGGTCPTYSTSGNGLMYRYTPILTVTPGAANGTYGQAAPTFSYTLNGYNAGDAAVDAVTGAPTLSTNYTQGSNTGQYNITSDASGMASAMGYGFAGMTRGAGLYIGRATITVTANSKAMTYGDGNSLNGYSISGVYSADTVGPATVSTSAASSSSGNWKAGNYTILANNLTGYNANNYTVRYVSGTLSIAKKVLTATATALNKVYDATTAATVSLTDNRIAGDKITVNKTSAVFSDKNAANGKTVTISGITLVSADAGNYTVAGTATTTANITPAALTVKAKNQSMTYGAGNNFTAGFTASGLKGTDKVTSVSDTTNATTSGSGNWNAGTWNIAASNASGANFLASNYNINYVNGTLTVAKKALTITASAQNKTYDATTAATINFVDNHIAGDNIIDSKTSAVFANKNVGNGKTVTISGIAIGGADAANYKLSGSTTRTTTANITPASLTVAANDQTMSYGAGNVLNAGYNITGLQGGETVGPLTLSTNATNSASGNWNANPNWKISTSNATGGTFSASNYTITYVKGTLNVTPASLTVKAGNESMVYGAGNNLTGGYSITGLKSGETVGSASLSTNATTSGSGNWNAGSWNIGVTNATGGTFNANNYTINYVSGQLDVAQKNLNVTATAQNKTYDATRNATVALADNHIAGDNVTTSNSSALFDTKNAGTNKTVTVSGISLGGADAANYSNNTTTTASADIAQADLTITANNKAMTYGDGNSFNGFTATGLQGGETVGNTDLSTGAGVSGSGNWNAGHWSIDAANATGGTFSAGNYNIHYTSGSLDVAQKDLNVTATAQNKTYDATRNATVTLADNHIAGDNISTSNSSALFDTKDTGTGKTVSVSGISISGADAANYSNNTTTSATADVNAADLTITANNKAMTYGDGNSLNGFAASGLQGGETVGSTSLSTNAGVSGSGNWNAGNWNIDVSNAAGGTFDAGNYNIHYVDGQLDVAQKDLSVTATAQNKTYDATRNANVTLADNHIAGDSVTANGSALFDTKDAGTGKTVTVSGIGISGADAANYSANSVTSATADINQANLNVIADSKTKVAGANDPALTFAYNGFVGGEDASLFSGGLVRDAGEAASAIPYAINLGSLSAGGNYAINYIGGSFTITPAVVESAAPGLGGDLLANINSTSGQISSFNHGNFYSGQGSNILLAMTNSIGGHGMTGGLGGLAPSAGNDNAGLTTVAGDDTIALIQCDENHPCTVAQ